MLKNERQKRQTLELSRVDTFHAVTGAVIFEDHPETLKHDSAAHRTSDQILLHDAGIEVLFLVEEEITKLVLETVTA